LKDIFLQVKKNTTLTLGFSSYLTKRPVRSSLVKNNYFRSYRDTKTKNTLVRSFKIKVGHLALGRKYDSFAYINFPKIAY